MWLFGIGIPRRLFLHSPPLLFGHAFCAGLSEHFRRHALLRSGIHVRRETCFESGKRCGQNGQAEVVLELGCVHEGAFKRRPARIIIAGLRLSGVSLLRGPQLR